MDVWNAYIDRLETQIRLDGFMTWTMRGHLSRLRSTVDAETGRRIDGLVARFHRPYASKIVMEWQ